MTAVIVHLIGCDDTTHMEVAREDEAALRRLAVASLDASRDNCQPTAHVGVDENCELCRVAFAPVETDEWHGIVVCRFCGINISRDSWLPHVEGAHPAALAAAGGKIMLEADQ